MELVDGQPLSALLRPEEPMDPEVARDLLAQAADAIGAAHAAGIIHRDVKPANLLVTPAREVKITDFGIARAAEGMALTQTGQVMGTPQYLSPEQARGTTATPASDVYSLGVVAFECLAGHRPFVADTPVATALAHLREPVPPLPPEVPADLAAVVRKAMSKEPGDRYPDGAAFAAALRDPATAATAIVAAPDTGSTQVLAGAGAGAAAGTAVGAAADATGATPATTPGPEPDQQPRRRRGALWLLAGGLAVLAALVIGFLVFAGEGDQTSPPDSPTPSPSKSQRPTKAPTTTEPSETPTSQTPTPSPTTSSPSATPTQTSTPSQSATTSPSPTETTTPSETTSGSTTPASQAPETTTAPSSSAPTAPGAANSGQPAPTDNGKAAR
jgi:serine/threonine-protein kinase